MAGIPYDSVKAHNYYERTKELKGRTKGTKTPEGVKSSKDSNVQSVRSRVVRLKRNVSTLQNALSEAQATLSKKRQTSAKTEKANSDGKTTVKERQASKESRDKHPTATKNLQRGSKPSSGSSKTSSKSVSDMSVQDLQARVIKIRSTLRDAKRQLSSASQQLGQIAHSTIASKPNVDEYFAHFQSAERTPSQ